MRRKNQRGGNGTVTGSDIVEPSVPSTPQEVAAANAVNQIEQENMRRVQEYKAKLLAPVQQAAAVGTGMVQSVVENRLDGFLPGTTGTGTSTGETVSSGASAAAASIAEKLKVVNDVLSDPAVVAQVNELASKGGLILKASEPFLRPLADEVVKQGSYAAEKAMDAGTTIVSNAIKEIPGVGLAYTLGQDAEKIAAAGLATATAVSEVANKFSATTQAIMNNIENQKQMAQQMSQQAVPQMQLPPVPPVQDPRNFASNVMSDFGKQKTDLATQLSNNYGLTGQQVAPAVQGGGSGKTRKRKWRNNWNKRYQKSGEEKVRMNAEARKTLRRINRSIQSFLFGSRHK